MSCGFIWEADSKASLGTDVEGSPTSPCRVPREERQVSAALREPEWTVVLLIEMELMGSPPDDDRLKSSGCADERPAHAIAERQTLTLRAWLQKKGRSFSDAADVFGSLMLSVRHIHRKRIVHADLKPDNIFCVAERSRVAMVRIGDFGLAGENMLFRQFDQSSLSSRGLQGGTPGYAAPEILKSLKATDRSKGEGCACSDKVDIFACAVIFLELLHQPFGTQMERVDLLERFHKQKALPDHIQMRLPKTRALLQQMAEPDPTARLSAEEVYKRFEKEVRKELCRCIPQDCCGGSTNLQKLPSQLLTAVTQGNGLRVPPAAAGTLGGNPATSPRRRQGQGRKGKRRSRLPPQGGDGTDEGQE